MKFFDYLESSYAKANIDVQKSYSPFLHAETQALSDLTNGQRKFFKFLAYFKVVFQYLLVIANINPAPRPAKEIITEMQEQQKAQADKLRAERQALLDKQKEEASLSLVPNEPLQS